MMMADDIVKHAQNKLVLDKYLYHNTLIENPVVLQLGGNDPSVFKQAMQIILNYSSSSSSSSSIRGININCGCPSTTVASTYSMGAAMMYDAHLTAACCLAVHTELEKYISSQSLIKHETKLSSPSSSSSFSSDCLLSVKCRIGVDDHDSYEALHDFINIVHTKGEVNQFQIHARKAILNLSAKDNRDIPPLNYNYVYRLVRDFPHIEFILNGGLQSYHQLNNCFYDCINYNDNNDTIHTSSVTHTTQTPLNELKGVMIGRSCVNHPYMWIGLDNYLDHINNNNNNKTQLDHTTVSLPTYTTTTIDTTTNNVLVSDTDHSRSYFYPSRGEILDQYIAYCQDLEKSHIMTSSTFSSEVDEYEDEFDNNDSDSNNILLNTRSLLAPVYNLFVGEEHSFKFQRKLKKLSMKLQSPSEILKLAVADMTYETLYGRRGEYIEIQDILNRFNEKMPKLTAPMQTYIY